MPLLIKYMLKHYGRVIGIGKEQHVATELGNFQAHQQVWDALGIIYCYNLTLYWLRSSHIFLLKALSHNANLVYDDGDDDLCGDVHGFPARHDSLSRAIFERGNDVSCMVGMGQGCYPSALACRLWYASLACGCLLRHLQ